jgi:hypothetical protein
MGQLGFVDAMLVLMVLLGDVGAKEFLYFRF